MTFARRVFAIAALWGLLVIPPMYFLEAKNGRDYPPEINHPEYYYGFVGVTLAFQFVFVVIARDPVRHRGMILPSIVEKLSFAIAAPILYLQHRVPSVILGFSLVDLLLGFLFVASWVKTPRRRYP